MSDSDPFIRYLHSLKYEDTGTLAAFRRACGQRLAESRSCQDFASVSTRPADFLTVTLAAQYQSDKIKSDNQWPYKGRGNIGAAWASYCRTRKHEDDPHTFYKNRQDKLVAGQPVANIPNIHERFRTILDTELELDGTGELAYRLRGLVRMLVAEDVPIDVIQLAWDLRQWRAENRCVQERWAKAFYAPPGTGTADRTQPEDESEIDGEQNNADDEEHDDAD